MFPHMYKVRPAKSQQVKDSDMATDCQWQRGENFRKNSGRWGSQGWDAPPAMPPPPPEAQDNLTRKSSLVNADASKPTISNQKSRLEEDKTKPNHTNDKARNSKENVTEDDMAKATRLWLQSSQNKQKGVEKNVPIPINDPKTYKVKTPGYIQDWLDPNTGEEKQEKRYCDDWGDENIGKQNPPAIVKKKSIPVTKTDETSKQNEPRSRPELKSQQTTENETVNQPKDEKPSQKEASPGGPPPPPPPPPPPSMGPPPPPPPPPLTSKPPTEDDIKMKKARQQMVEKIKKASRVRPDWQSVMKDIEGGIKLKKVKSAEKLDRSSPILPDSRGNGGKFLYDSEIPIAKNELLTEIHRGVRLRHVRTNDRSKPDFNKLGLRKLRRQLTVEEKKKIDPDNPETLPSSSDEEEDIDRMRDDIVATKSQLADEIKKNKKMETEHKILKIDIESLHAEVKKMKKKLKEAGIHEVKPLANGEAYAIGPKLSKSMSKLRMMEDEVDFSELDVIEEDIKILNDEIEAQKKRAEKAEQKSEELKLKLQVAGNAAEEWEMRSIYFEKKCKQLQKDIGIELPDINCVGVQCDLGDLGHFPLKSESSGGILAKKSASKKALTTSFARMESFQEEDSEEETTSSEEESTVSDHPGDDEDDEQGEIEEEVVEKMDEMDIVANREERDFIMWKNKLTHVKDKERNVIRERNSLREKINKIYKDMRKEREEYLKIKAELEELSNQMKEGVDDDSEDEKHVEQDEDISDDDSINKSSGNPQIPVKFSTKKNQVEEEEEEEECSEDEIVDFSGLETPEWTESEAEESDFEEDENDTANRLKQLQEQTKIIEERASEKKKDTYRLKVQIDSCEEMLAEEKWRHNRLQNELQMLLADI